MNDSEPTCPSCGIEYSMHMGIICTCEALQMARERITELQDDIVLQQSEIAELLNDVAAAKHRRNVAVKELQKLNKGKAK
jgi:hypothetical protein